VWPLVSAIAIKLKCDRSLLPDECTVKFSPRERELSDDQLPPLISCIY